jgi:catechol 2,3-dioxygenase-like lactoylglutathione lyase family enzyme
MLSKLVFHATIPAKDLERAKKFYADKLGFIPDSEEPGGLVYKCKDSWFLLYPTQFAGTAAHTLGGWETTNIEQEVAGLKARGVVFEEYDFPGLKTVNSIAAMGSDKAAWFKDSEGNILGIIQLAHPVS